jgi:hypothetical protein
MGRNIPAVFLSAIVLAAAMIALQMQFRPAAGDPVRPFHLALSRDLAKADTFRLDSLPAAEDIGWSKYFFDRDFFFHVLSSTGYRLAQERGVELVPRICALATLLAFFAFALTYLPFYAAFLATLSGFFTYAFLARLFALSPASLAALCFLALNFGLLQRKSLLAAAAGFLYVLSCSAWFAPLACLCLIFLLSWLEDREEGKELRTLAAKTMAGCIAGLLLNPYFPGNLVAAYRELLLPFLLRTTLAPFALDSELGPTNTLDFLENNLPQLFFLALGIFVFGSRPKNGRAGDFPLRYQLSLCLVMFVASCFFARAAEFFALATGILLVVAMARWPWQESWRISCLVGMVLLQAFQFLQQSGAVAEDKEIARHFASMSAAIAAIPKESRKKVYNCEWEAGSWIYYQRPDLRFVDLLDPTLLHFWDARSSFARAEFRRGGIGDAWGMLSGIFDADYVLCPRGLLSEQLAADPAFQQIYPSPRNTDRWEEEEEFLFKVRRTPSPEFVTSFEAQSQPKLTAKEAANYAPPVRSSGGDFRQTLSGSYINLPGGSQPGDGLRCMLLRPKVQEIIRHAGAEVLVLGGGQILRSWQNAAPLPASARAFTFSRSTELLVPLLHPLKEGDSLIIQVCSDPEAPLFALSASLWTFEGLRKLCAWKSGGADQSRASREDGNFWTDPPAETCLGEMALRKIPEGLRSTHF